MKDLSDFKHYLGITNKQLVSRSAERDRCRAGLR